MDLQRHEHSKKVPKEELNVEYAKNILVKLFVGTADSMRMSLKVLQSLLKLSDAESKLIEKQLKL